MNNKAERNRCLIPRLSTKLGEKDLEKWMKEDKIEKEELAKPCYIWPSCGPIDFSEEGPGKTRE